MKYSINKISAGEDELILNYKTESSETKKIIQFMKNFSTKLVGKTDEGNNEIINVNDILYFETIEEKTFAYTNGKVFKIDFTLLRLGEVLTGKNFFRCSKSIIINIDKIRKLKSLPSNRIDAVMQGDYHIIISRTYAAEFRQILKNGF